MVAVPLCRRVENSLYWFTCPVFDSRMKKLLSFVKIEHTLFSLPLIYSGVFLASRAAFPAWRILILVLTAATGARTVAFALNRIIDRRIDARNPRTASRDLPSGRMTLTEALGVLFAGLALYAGSAYLISDFCFLMSPVPLAVFVIYPTMKRFTPIAHFGVGMGLAMGPLGGWFAVSPSFDRLLAPAILSFFTLFWVAGFDIIYSTLDEEFDKKELLYSFPTRSEGTGHFDTRVTFMLSPLSFSWLCSSTPSSLSLLSRCFC